MAKPQDRNALFDEMLRGTLDRYPVTLGCRCEISAANTDMMEYVVRPMLFEGTRDGVRLISQRGHLAHNMIKKQLLVQRNEWRLRASLV